jgi:hypothetical protein
MMYRTHYWWILLWVAVSVGGCGASEDAVTVDSSGEAGNDTAVLAEDIVPDQSTSDVSKPDIVDQDGTSIDTATPDGEEVQGSDVGTVVGTVDVVVVDVDVDVDIDVATEDVMESGPVVLPEGLIGTPVSIPTLPPEFVAVVDSDGNEVTAADLLGSPTIMWFFPLPSTPG